jgi:quercetin 2,3-dioxygenase
MSGQGGRAIVKSIRRLHRAQRSDVEGLLTYRAFPLPSLDAGRLNPFIFLNHHGPQTYPPGNAGLPFGPHPHRGFETVTFILSGDLVHKDNGGYRSLIAAGGVQWMTAGSGLIHAEVSSDEFKSAGGHVEILQLWVNLPATLKLAPPRYVGLQKEEVPEIVLDEGAVCVNLISGDWDKITAPIETLTDVHLCSISFRRGAGLERSLATDRRVFCYVVSGELKVNDVRVEARHTVEFGEEGERVVFEALADSVIIFGHAEPLREPVAAYGPFVMNTEAEIEQAIRDYRAGRFGVWND